MNQAEKLKSEFIPKYMMVGATNFYRFLIVYAMNKLVEIENKSYKGTSPEIDFLNYHDQFLAMYRREGENILLELAKVFRKAGHKVYRTLLKKGLTNRNTRFLNLVVI
jgi:hypothetical protein